MMIQVDNPLATLATINHGKEVDIENVGLYCGSFGDLAAVTRSMGSILCLEIS
jgi:hypothetical protein